MTQNIDLKNIMENTRHLALKIGPRPAGSVKANEAANWFKERLKQLDYTPQVYPFKLPNGSEGQNILCLIEGQTQQVIVIAAHLDTVEQSPGANDDASGLALLIELARVVKHDKLSLKQTVILAGFGAEEAIEGYRGHNFSSLNYLKSLTAENRRKIVGCIYLDKIGVGQRLLIRNVIFNSSQMVKHCQEAAGNISKSEKEYPIKDGWLLSLPMSFTKFNIPTAYIEWAPDSHMHKDSDLPDNLIGEKILLVAKIVLQVLLTGKIWEPA